MVGCEGCWYLVWCDSFLVGNMYVVDVSMPRAGPGCFGLIFETLYTPSHVLEVFGLNEFFVLPSSIQRT